LGSPLCLCSHDALLELRIRLPPEELTGDLFEALRLSRVHVGSQLIKRLGWYLFGPSVERVIARGFLFSHLVDHVPRAPEYLSIFGI
jgi:hypothetical protein